MISKEWLQKQSIDPYIKWGDKPKYLWEILEDFYNYKNAIKQPVPKQFIGTQEVAIDILSTCALKYIFPDHYSDHPQNVINNQIDYAKKVINTFVENKAKIETIILSRKILDIITNYVDIPDEKIDKIKNSLRTLLGVETL